jgi:hypothetical protein
VRSDTKGILTGTVLSAVYFRVSESGQSPDSNCSYLAPASTDVMALLAAGVLYWQARKNNNFWVASVAGAIAGIHFQQWRHYKMAA